MNMPPGASRRLVVVVGIRSQYVKLAAIQPQFDCATGLDCAYIDTGQHYDGVLAGQYIDEYGLRFDHSLRCGSPDQTPSETLARMLVRVEAVLANEAPAGVLVFGDANTTLAAALAARRLGIAVAHLEAGVRTGADTPEELNRVVVDRVASLHLAATQLDLGRLQDEGFGSTSVFVGDVVRDLCQGVAPEQMAAPYGLVTIHRAENTKDSGVVMAAAEALRRHDLTPVIVFHPRVLRLVQTHSPELLERALALESVPHARMLRLMKGARVIVTDSGALQRESYYLGRRAVVVQDEPFWRSLIDSGFHIGVSPAGDLAAGVALALGPPPVGVVEFGTPGVGSRVVSALERWAIST